MSQDLKTIRAELIQRAEAEKAIMDIDLQMSSMAQQEGFYTALLHYADDDFVKFDEGMLPAIGKSAFQNRTEGKPGTKALEWRPVKAEVAASGDLGYTWGNWKLTLQDTVMHGVYFSVWRKSADNIWKLVLDGGNTTPPGQ